MRFIDSYTKSILKILMLVNQQSVILKIMKQINKAERFSASNIEQIFLMQ